MSYLRSLPPESGMLQIWQAFPETVRPLLEYHEALLRGDSPLTIGERELIAAYVSGLNDCRYCHGVHSQTASAFGIRLNTIRNLLSDWRQANVNPRLRPILRFVRKLTLSPTKITAADVGPIFAAGWNDRALHDAVAVCALFNFMNRLVNGLGVEASKDYIRMAAERAARGGYAQLLDLLRESK
jgi:uncharacterized peroxidase-related enzyme